MLSLFDRVSMERALSLPLDPKLRRLLSDRVAHTITGEFDLSELTQFVIVESGITEAEIMDEIGMSPLINPLDGSRFGSGDFHPWWEGLEDHDGWFEMIVTVGNSGFAYLLMIEDNAFTESDLLALCRHYAGEGR